MKQGDGKNENYSAILPNLVLAQIYAEWYILIGFSYSSKPVGFKAI